MRLVPLNLLKLCSACISLADSSKTVQIFCSFFQIYISCFYAVFTWRNLCLKNDLYPVLWWCVGGGWGGGGDNEDVARLLLTGYGIAVSEILRVVGEDAAFKFVSPAPQIASNRSLLLMDANIFVCSSKRILANNS